MENKDIGRSIFDQPKQQPNEAKKPQPFYFGNPNEFLPTSNVLQSKSGQSKYDDSRYSARDSWGSQEGHRASNQGLLDVAGNAIGRLVGTTATKTINGFAHIGSALGGLAVGTWDYAINGKTFAEGFDWALNNVVTESLNGLEQGIKDNLKIYANNDYYNGNFFDKLSTAKFWAEDVIDGVSYMASAFLGNRMMAGQLNKLSVLSKVDDIEKAVSAGSDVSKIQRAMIESLKLNREGWLKAGTTFLQSSSEAMVEASEVNKSVRDKLYREIGEGKIVMSDEEVKQRAGTAAAKTFAWNFSLLSFTNRLETGFALGKNKEGLSYLDNALKEANKEKLELMKLYKTDKKAALERLAEMGIYDGKKAFGEFGKGLLKGVAMEGFLEENMQTNISKYLEKKYGDVKNDAYNEGFFDEIGNVVIKGLKGVKTGLKGFASFLPGEQYEKDFEANSEEDEILTSIFLGGIMGGPMNAFQSMKEYGDNVKHEDNVKNKFNNLLNIDSKVAHNLFNAISASFLNEDGTVDQAKAEEAGLGLATMSLTNGMLAEGMVNNDKEKQDIAKRLGAAQIIFRLLTAKKQTDPNQGFDQFEQEFLMHLLTEESPEGQDQYKEFRGHLKTSYDLLKASLDKARKSINLSSYELEKKRERLEKQLNSPSENEVREEERGTISDLLEETKEQEEMLASFRLKAVKNLFFNSLMEDLYANTQVEEGSEKERSIKEFTEKKEAWLKALNNKEHTKEINDYLESFRAYKGIQKELTEINKLEKELTELKSKEGYDKDQESVLETNIKVAKDRLAESEFFGEKFGLNIRDGYLVDKNDTWDVFDKETWKGSVSSIANKLRSDIYRRKVYEKKILDDLASYDPQSNNELDFIKQLYPLLERIKTLPNGEKRANQLKKQIFQKLKLKRHIDALEKIEKTIDDLNSRIESIEGPDGMFLDELSDDQFDEVEALREQIFNIEQRTDIQELQEEMPDGQIRGKTLKQELINKASYAIEMKPDENISEDDTPDSLESIAKQEDNEFALSLKYVLRKQVNEVARSLNSYFKEMNISWDYDTIKKVLDDIKKNGNTDSLKELLGDNLMKLPTIASELPRIGSLMNDIETMIKYSNKEAKLLGKKSLIQKSGYEYGLERFREASSLIEQHIKSVGDTRIKVLYQSAQEINDISKDILSKLGVSIVNGIDINSDDNKDLDFYALLKLHAVENNNADVLDSQMKAYGFISFSDFEESLSLHKTVGSVQSLFKDERRLNDFIGKAISIYSSGLSVEKLMEYVAKNYPIDPASVKEDNDKKKELIENLKAFDKSYKEKLLFFNLMLLNKSGLTKTELLQIYEGTSEFAPTMQQMLATDTLIASLFTDRGELMTAALSGLAGSGKTSQIVKRVYDFYVRKNPKDKVILLGHTDNSAALLKSSIGENSNAVSAKISSIEDLYKYLDENDVLIIDEAFALPKEIFLEIRRLISKTVIEKEDLREKYKNKKILLLGDNTQYNHDPIVSSSLFMLRNNSAVLAAQLLFNYRTSVPEIDRVANHFRKNDLDEFQHIDEVNCTKSSFSDLMDSLSKGIEEEGVFTTSPENILKLVDASANNGKSKLLIVDEKMIDSIKQKYKDRKDITIVLYSESGGLTRDQVFILPQFTPPTQELFFKANSLYYTLITRAKQLVVMAGNASVNEISSLNKAVDEQNAKNEKNVNIALFNKHIKSLGGTTLFKEKEAKKPENETEDEKKDAQEEPEVKEEPKEKPAEKSEEQKEEEAIEEIVEAIVEKEDPETENIIIVKEDTFSNIRATAKTTPQEKIFYDRLNMFYDKLISIMGISNPIIKITNGAKTSYYDTKDKTIYLREEDILSPHILFHEAFHYLIDNFSNENKGKLYSNVRSALQELMKNDPSIQSLFDKIKEAYPSGTVMLNAENEELYIRLLTELPNFIVLSKSKVLKNKAIDLIKNLFKSFLEGIWNIIFSDKDSDVVKDMELNKEDIENDYNALMSLLFNEEYFDKKDSTEVSMEDLDKALLEAQEGTAKRNSRKDHIDLGDLTKEIELGDLVKENIAELAVFKEENDGTVLYLQENTTANTAQKAKYPLRLRSIINGASKDIAYLTLEDYKAIARYNNWNENLDIDDIKKNEDKYTVKDFVASKLSMARLGGLQSANDLIENANEVFAALGTSLKGSFDERTKTNVKPFLEIVSRDQAKQRFKWQGKDKESLNGLYLTFKNDEKKVHREVFPELNYFVRFNKINLENYISENPDSFLKEAHNQFTEVLDFLDFMKNHNLDLDDPLIGSFLNAQKGAFEYKQETNRYALNESKLNKKHDNYVKLLEKVKSNQGYFNEGLFTENLYNYYQNAQTVSVSINISSTDYFSDAILAMSKEEINNINEKIKQKMSFEMKNDRMTASFNFKDDAWQVTVTNSNGKMKFYKASYLSSIGIGTTTNKDNPKSFAKRTNKLYAITKSTEYGDQIITEIKPDLKSSFASKALNTIAYLNMVSDQEKLSIGESRTERIGKNVAVNAYFALPIRFNKKNLRYKQNKVDDVLVKFFEEVLTTIHQSTPDNLKYFNIKYLSMNPESGRSTSDLDHYVEQHSAMFSNPTIAKIVKEAMYDFPFVLVSKPIKNRATYSDYIEVVGNRVKIDKRKIGNKFGMWFKENGISQIQSEEELDSLLMMLEKASNAFKMIGLTPIRIHEDLKFEPISQTNIRPNASVLVEGIDEIKNIGEDEQNIYTDIDAMSNSLRASMQNYKPRPVTDNRFFFGPTLNLANSKLKEVVSISETKLINSDSIKKAKLVINPKEASMATANTESTKKEFIEEESNEIEVNIDEYEESDEYEGDYFDEELSLPYKRKLGNKIPKEGMQKMLNEFARFIPLRGKIRILIAKILKYLRLSSEDKINSIYNEYMPEIVVLSQIEWDKSFKKSAWGVFTKGKVFLKEDNGSFYDNVLRHEMMHYFFSRTMNEATREKYFKALDKFMDQKGINTTILTAGVKEEILADMFYEYLQKESESKIPSILKSLFNFLKGIINFVTNNESDLEILFNRLNLSNIKDQRVIDNGDIKYMDLEFDDEISKDRSLFSGRDEYLETLSLFKKKYDLFTNTGFSNKENNVLLPVLPELFTVDKISSFLMQEINTINNQLGKFPQTRKSLEVKHANNKDDYEKAMKILDKKEENYNKELSLLIKFTKGNNVGSSLIKLFLKQVNPIAVEEEVDSLNDIVEMEEGLLKNETTKADDISLLKTMMEAMKEHLSFIPKVGSETFESNGNIAARETDKEQFYSYKRAIEALSKIVGKVDWKLLVENDNANILSNLNLSLNYDDIHIINFVLNEIRNSKTGKSFFVQKNVKDIKIPFIKTEENSGYGKGINVKKHISHNTKSQEPKTFVHIEHDTRTGYSADEMNKSFIKNNALDKEKKDRLSELVELIKDENTDKDLIKEFIDKYFKHGLVFKPVLDKKDSIDLYLERMAMIKTVYEYVNKGKPADEFYSSFYFKASLDKAQESTRAILANFSSKAQRKYFYRERRFGSDFNYKQMATVFVNKNLNRNNAKVKLGKYLSQQSESNDNKNLWENSIDVFNESKVIFDTLGDMATRLNDTFKITYPFQGIGGLVSPNNVFKEEDKQRLLSALEAANIPDRYKELLVNEIKNKLFPKITSNYKTLYNRYLKETGQATSLIKDQYNALIEQGKNSEAEALKQRYIRDFEVFKKSIPNISPVLSFKMGTSANSGLIFNDYVLFLALNKARKEAGLGSILDIDAGEINRQETLFRSLRLQMEPVKNFFDMVNKRYETLKDTKNSDSVSAQDREFLQAYGSESLKRMMNYYEKYHPNDYKSVDSSLNIIYDIISSNSEELGNLVAKMPDGKLIPSIQPGTYYDQTVDRFVLMSGDKEWNKNKLPANFLTYGYHFNPFVNGNLRIYDKSIDYGLYNDFNNSVKQYLSENDTETLSRELIFGFISQLEKVGNELTYQHYTYPFSNRGSGHALRLRYIKNDEKDFFIDLIAEEYLKTHNYKNDKYINLPNFKGDFNKANIVKYINEKMKTEKEDLLRIIQYARPFFDENSLTNIASILEYTQSNETISGGKFKASKKETYSSVEIDAIEKMLEVFIYTNYINSHFVNEIYGGSELALHKSSTNLVKRLQGASSTGEIPVSSKNNDSFAKEDFKVLIIEDPERISGVPVGLQKASDSIQSKIKLNEELLKQELAKEESEINKGKVALYKDKIKVYSKQLSIVYKLNTPIATLVKDLYLQSFKKDKNLKNISDEDLMNNYPEIWKELQFVVDQFYSDQNDKSDKSIESTDGAAFMTEKRLEDLRKGLPQNYKLGESLKLMYYGTHVEPKVIGKYESLEDFKKSDKYISDFDSYYKYDDNTQEISLDKEILIYGKNSHQVITSDMKNKFPFLNDLANFLEKNNISEMAFKSGIKLDGGSNNSITYEELMKGVVGNEDDFDLTISHEERRNRREARMSILAAKARTMKTSNVRVQFNPVKNLNMMRINKIPLPSQIMFFLNSNLKDNAYSKAAYLAVAALMAKGRKNVLSFDPNGLILDALKNAPESKLLHAVAKENFKVAVNTNLGMQKMAVTYSSQMFKQAFKKKTSFKGASLVLAPLIGTELMLDKKTGEYVNKELEYYVDENNILHAEVMVSEEFVKNMNLPKNVEDAIMRGEDMYKYFHALGFRLPSTEIHSGVILKIVGFHNKSVNTILAPTLLQAIHGSDFDIDKLYIIVRETGDSNGLKLFKGEDGKYEYDTDFQGLFGYKKDSSGKMVIDYDFEKGTSNSLSKIYNKMEEIKAMTNVDEKDRENTLKELSKLEDKFLRNIIIESIMSSMSNPDNIGRMLTPISTALFDDEIDRFRDLGWGDLIDQKVNLNLLSNKIVSKRNIGIGVKLTGVYATFLKVMSYLKYAQIEGDPNNRTILMNSFNQLYSKLEKAKTISEIESIKQEILAFEKEHLSDTIVKIDKEFSFSIKNESGEEMVFDRIRDNSIDPVTMKWNNMSVSNIIDVKTNLAIDNVKEMKLGVLHYSLANAGMSNVLTMLGVPLSIELNILKNSSILALDKYSYNQDVKDAFSAMKKDLKFLSNGKAEAFEITSKDIETYAHYKYSDVMEEIYNAAENNISLEQLLKTKLKGFEEKDILRFIATQLFIIGIMEKALVLSDANRVLQDLFNPLRIDENDLEEKEKLMDSLENLIDKEDIKTMFAEGAWDYKDFFDYSKKSLSPMSLIKMGETQEETTLVRRFPYDVSNLFRRIPHAREALLRNYTVIKELEKIQLSNNPIVKDFLEEKLRSLSESDFNERSDRFYETLKLMKEEFSYFLQVAKMPSIMEKYVSGNSIKDQFGIEMPNEEKYKFYVSSLIAQLKDQFGSNNLFLQYVKTFDAVDQNNIHMGDLQIKPGQEIFFKQAFNELSKVSIDTVEFKNGRFIFKFKKNYDESNEIIEHLMTFANIFHKMRPSVSNYVNLIPEELLGEFLTRNSVVTEVEEILNGNNDIAKQNLLNHFYYSMIGRRSDIVKKFGMIFMYEEDNFLDEDFGDMISMSKKQERQVIASDRIGAYKHRKSSQYIKTSIKRYSGYEKGVYFDLKIVHNKDRAKELDQNGKVKSEEYLEPRHTFITDPSGKGQVFKKVFNDEQPAGEDKVKSIVNGATYYKYLPKVSYFMPSISDLQIKDFSKKSNEILVDERTFVNYGTNFEIDEKNGTIEYWSDVPVKDILFSTRNSYLLLDMNDKSFANKYEVRFESQSIAQGSVIPSSFARGKRPSEHKALALSNQDIAYKIKVKIIAAYTKDSPLVEYIPDIIDADKNGVC